VYWTLLQQDNCFLLRRFLTIIESLTDSQYLLDKQPLFNSSIGAHTRHVLDHYQAFIDGLPMGHINYDARARVLDVELNRSVAIEKMNAVIACMAQIENHDQSLLVSMDIGVPETKDIVPQRSTVGRELAFLHGHSVHHEALIAFILRALNVDIDVEEVGLAPSTVKHREAL
jgi:uncharacterized damage-inducible protein DinB